MPTTSAYPPYAKAHAQQEADQLYDQCREIGAVVAKYRPTERSAGLQDIADAVVEGQEPAWDYLSSDDAREALDLGYPTKIALAGMQDGFRTAREALRTAPAVPPGKARPGDIAEWLDINGARQRARIERVTGYAVELADGRGRICRHMLAAGAARLIRAESAPGVMSDHIDTSKPASAPYTVTTSRTGSANGSPHVYVTDAAGRKIAAVWGGPEKFATADLIAALAGASVVLCIAVGA